MVVTILGVIALGFLNLLPGISRKLTFTCSCSSEGRLSLGGRHLVSATHSPHALALVYQTEDRRVIAQHLGVHQTPGALFTFTLGYEDNNDSARLSKDPALKIMAGYIYDSKVT